MTKVFSAKSNLNIKKAAQILQRGGIISFPTETVYGLGADALKALAVRKIFKAKGRPSFDPLIVHVASPLQAQTLWSYTPKIAQILMKKFWPGPLTIVLPKNKIVPDIVTAGLSTVAVRMPKNQTALKLIGLAKTPIAAPSANRFGYTSPTTAQDVAQDLGEKIDFILDDGPCVVGVESTVIKIENNQAILLRPGGISIQALQKYLPVSVLRTGQSILKSKGKAAGFVSPGLLRSHYAPKTPLILLNESRLNFLKKVLKNSNLQVGIISFGKTSPLQKVAAHQVLSQNKNLNRAASKLFRAMRILDRMGLDLIVAEPVPMKGIGVAMMDRLARASIADKDVPKLLKKLKGK